MRGNKLSESRAMRNNSLIPNLQFQRAAEELRQELERNQGDKGSSAVDSAIPSWLSKAPDELAE